MCGASLYFPIRRLSRLCGLVRPQELSVDVPVGCKHPVSLLNEHPSNFLAAFPPPVGPVGDVTFLEFLKPESHHRESGLDGLAA